MLPLSRKVAPWRSPRIGKRYSRIGLEFKITRTVDVSVFIVVAVLIVASGTDAADRKSTDAIRSADVELLVIRGGTGVAVAINSAGH